MKSSLLLSSLVLAGCAAVSAAPNDPAPIEPLAAAVPVAVRAYHVIAKHSGLFLAIREARCDEGLDAIQWTDSGGDEQRFELVDAGHGTVRIRAAHSGKYLAVAGARMDWGAPIVQVTDGTAPAAQWLLEPAAAGGDWFHVRSMLSEQALAVSAKETSAGSLVIQWPSYDGDEQLWRFVLSQRNR